MVYQYRFHAPGSELHGEPFDIQSTTRASADARAEFHVRDTFSLTTRRDVSAEFLAEYTSRRALELADTMPAPADSATTCKRHDFRDGDVCSRCDAMRGVA